MTSQPKKQEKLCVFCKLFVWNDVDYQHISTLTGGELSGGLACAKLIFYDALPRDTESFRELILTAETCVHYTPACGETT